MDLMTNKLGKSIMGHVQHYNPDKYWKRRNVVVNPKSKSPYFLKVFYLFYIKRCDAFNNASMGTSIGSGASFKTPPLLPHHLNGIIVGHNVVVGENVTIYQQVTIAQAPQGSNTIIGDNVLIGKGATILGGCRVGNNVKIGANCVVNKDVPDNCTVVGVPFHIVNSE